MRSPIPRSLKATDVNAASGTTQAMATAAMPIRLRIRADGTRRSAPASTAAPTRMSSTIISSTRAPKSPATASFAVRGWKAFVNGSFESAQADDGGGRDAGHEQHRQAAQPQRHQHEPREGTHRRCRGGAARLGEEDRHDGHAHGRVRQHAQERAAGLA